MEAVKKAIGDCAYDMVVWDDYYAVMAARFDWASILDRYGVQRVAVDPERSVNLLRALEASGTWSEIWRTDHGDSHAVVWSRNP